MPCICLTSVDWFFTTSSASFLSNITAVLLLVLAISITALRGSIIISANLRWKSVHLAARP